ncbi:serine protease [Streptacidiphilus pinicola]|uniref:Serine protease n=1 Tax=Streptacidiphilus pinicola TaxID=2219663 RepID=A0A2X0JIJ1_9ACTN|nr:trypsin-like peptidase domain-containing protein [Streptacidiphilus pinicola]RAG87538.1 serine protease [Streptacidiphilus pinicola]
MRWSAAGLTACGIAVSLGIAGCTVSSSTSTTSSWPTHTPASSTSSTSSGAGGGSGSRTLAQVAAGSVDLVSEQSLSGTEAAGTGIVLTSDGEVLTNNHVISGATSLTAVDIGNGHSYSASVIGYDRSHDLALVQLHGASGLQTLDLASGTRVSVGEAVTALGNAGGRGGQPSRASGSVTALDQQITASDESTGSSEQLSGLIQVDAPIQAGDSGGPLVNAQGQVIGIDTAASVGYQFQNAPAQGFAIPADQARATANAIAAGQSSSTVHIGATAWLGIAVSSSNQNLAGAGATVVQVVPNSPADQLGLVPGDVITSLDGSSVADANALTALLGRYHPGNTVTLGWTDGNGQAQSSRLALGNGPAG